jgi:AraC-like DNA-binding protein
VGVRALILDSDWTSLAVAGRRAIECRAIRWRAPGSIEKLYTLSSTAQQEVGPCSRCGTHIHVQRLKHAARLYLCWCYKRKTAARTSELAHRLGVLPQYLSWIAPQILGMPLHVFLREKQLVEAERLLIHTPMKVDEIAFRAAFGTPSTFYRWFKEKHGMAPGAFRELNQ